MKVSTYRIEHNYTNFVISKERYTKYFHIHNIYNVLDIGILNTRMATTIYFAIIQSIVVIYGLMSTSVKTILLTAIGSFVISKLTESFFVFEQDAQFFIHFVLSHE